MKTISIFRYLSCLLLTGVLYFTVHAQIIISQYYEGAGTNKWIELTNLGNAAVNTASPQLKLGIWQVTGSTGNINITGAPTATVNLAITIPAKGSVLIGNTTNGTEVPYLTAASAAQTSNTVINFNGNDGIALLDASNNVIDAFGTGINAADISYRRNISVVGSNTSFTISEWTSLPLTTVQNAIDIDNPDKLGVHLPPLLPTCIAPVSQPTSLAFGTVTTNSVAASFTAAVGTDEYLIVRSTNSSLSTAPVNGTVYNAGDNLGGGVVVNRSAATSFTATGLAASTTYYFFIFSVNNNTCTGGPLYFVPGVLSGQQTTNTPPVCATPANQPTAFTITSFSYNFIQASFTPVAGADEFIVVMSTSISLGAAPINGVVYSINNNIGTGTVVSKGANTNFSKSGLTPSTPYYFFVFALNSFCSGGPSYNTVAPLTGNQTTPAYNPDALNFYFGNLHAHSSFSDGNKDNTAKTPIDDYAFAKTALCMDFLGLSEHNHTGAGMHLSNWQPGITYATNATTTNFVALHGMEWGVISGGGHVIVYGMDSLIGWEPGEYQVYVPKSTYTGTNGLFTMVNRHGNNAIAYLAHPNSADYNNIAAAYDLNADNAIVGTAVESGPAFSTTIDYTNPSSISFLGYYNTMLAKGYHLGATIDHDNHNLTFGKTAKTRLVILAPALTENDLLNGLKQMHFYASEDCGARITFAINSKPVGSVFSNPNAPVISINSVTSSPVSSIKIFSGTPGSGTAPTQLNSGATGTLNYTDNSLSNLSTRYYYADITEADGSRIITSPIWYTRDDAFVLPTALVSFFAMNEPEHVMLKWTTSGEKDNTVFTVQRSADNGRTYIDIGEQAGNGYATFAQYYAISDQSPYEGLAFYRLMQKSINGTVQYSSVITVNRGLSVSPYFTIYPNPVHNIANIELYSPKTGAAYIELYDMAGRQIVRRTIAINAGKQLLSFNMAGIQRGTYIIKINCGDTLMSKMINKQ
jgi:Secretion system C-terminal sorting domain/Lamin Tail Domain